MAEEPSEMHGVACITFTHTLLTKELEEGTVQKVPSA